ncbi:ABC transporter ATP-binding protein [Calycomorphotria hydatis]|uniref:Bicarbonate transport ATP-binding protein CmpD n=1 Tax=Calycomorphotria hydatis TaxID=2528027 RepID=A0A517TA01_9PLAN|nr:ABC transporter ATP-binding protein [Calycomorphotria hydatis]QDT65197.1 Bicarbonate transport ATP-binding protein CmpD [Calycomorphotria hydatis]
MSMIELRGVSKGYGQGHERTEVLSDINLTIEESEFVMVVGFSGSGKSTLVSLIAGLIEPDEGEILVDGKPITGPGPDRGVIFQNYSLLPWLTVGGNVELAVKQVFPEMSRLDRRAHVAKYVEMVNLTPAIWKRPHELSGGMRQRVSVARALAMQPETLLLDEPFSALDALTRATLQDELEKIYEHDKRTMFMITNDVDEALILADRIVPLKPGPNATLGPEFKVDLDRPRDRTSINHDPEFKTLRNEITHYLNEVNAESKSITVRSKRVCPDIKPIDLTIAS